MSADVRFTKRPLLGVDVTDVSMDGAVALLTSLLDDASGRSHSVYFVNAHTLNLACDDADFRQVLNRASYVLGDGTGVRWATRILHGTDPLDNTNGTDLTPKLFRDNAQGGYRYYLLGNTPELIAKAAAFTQREFPGWTLAGYHHGFIGEGDHARVVAEINESRPHLLLVGMGNPIQERWIDRHLAELRVPLSMAVGGLFDYWADVIPRSPLWVRKIGYEWLDKLIRQPHKARRYLLGNPKFLARVAACKLAPGSLAPR
jgi:N-acetylglucosaminyldiphosphoundecaprenol N-acetyl-beta-D-mannosaminyltransferase